MNNYMNLLTLITIFCLNTTIIKPMEIGPSKTGEGTPLHVAIEKRQIDDAIKIANEHTEWINIRDKNGLTPLLQAIDICSQDLIVGLLDAGADIRLKDPQGKTAFERASDNMCRIDYAVFKRLDTGKYSRPDTDWGGGERRRKQW